MVYCQNCNTWNDDINNFCGHCGAKLEEPANYCPNCEVTFNGGENFCTICGTRLVVRSKYNGGLRRKGNVSSKPMNLNSYKVHLETHNDGIIVDYRPRGAEFTDGKTKEELEMELQFVTRKLEDCQKNGDYMMSYYKEKKEILERALGIENPMNRGYKTPQKTKNKKPVSIKSNEDKKKKKTKKQEKPTNPIKKKTKKTIKLDENKIYKICADCHEMVEIEASVCNKCHSNSFVYDKNNSTLSYFLIKHDRNSIHKKWVYVQETNNGRLEIYAGSKNDLKNKVISNGLPWDDVEADNTRRHSIRKSSKQPKNRLG